LETAVEILNTRKSAKNFVKDLEEEIRYNIYVFKKFQNSMINPETKENREYIQLKYTKMEALIRCYGALMHRNQYAEKGQEK
jgi:hypothetical protein